MARERAHSPPSLVRSPVGAGPTAVLTRSPGPLPRPAGGASGDTRRPPPTRCRRCSLHPGRPARSSDPRLSGGACGTPHSRAPGGAGADHRRRVSSRAGTGRSPGGIRRCTCVTPRRGNMGSRRGLGIDPAAGGHPGGPSTGRGTTELRASAPRLTTRHQGDTFVTTTDVDSTRPASESPDEIAALTTPHRPDDWSDLDQRTVDTIRVLAADAVQKVGNGHPGTAMALAPLAYTLFQHTMRHDPADADWPGRDRFVLSAGHSSLTLYIQLFLAGYGLEMRTSSSCAPGAPPPRGTPSRLHHRRRDHHRPAGPGPRVQRRHGDGRPPRARPLRPRRRAGREPVRPLHLRHRLRRRHRGGRDGGGELDRRPPAARQPRRLLRRQPHLDRGRHHGGALRGRGRPLRGLRVAHPGGARRRERRRHPRGDREREGRHRPAQLHRAADRHRLSGAGQDEHRRGARRGAGCRRGRRGQEDPRVRPREVVPDRGRGPRPRA